MAEIDKPNDTALVVGSNRGIGLALVEALLSRNEASQVVATHRPKSDTRRLQSLMQRHPGTLQLLPLDFTEPGGMDSLSDYLAQAGHGLRWVIHAAGLLHEPGLAPEKSLEQCDPHHLLRLFEVNSIGPLMVAQAILSQQQRKHALTVAALSAMVGSIEDNRLGGWYGYRASKAALNQFVKTLSIECRTKFPRASVIAIHPGTTDTGLSRPFQGNIPKGRLYTPQQTAQRILDITLSVDPEVSGRFYNWDGSRIAW